MSTSSVLKRKLLAKQQSRPPKHRNIQAGYWWATVSLPDFIEGAEHEGLRIAINMWRATASPRQA